MGGAGQLMSIPIKVCSVGGLLAGMRTAYGSGAGHCKSAIATPLYTCYCGLQQKLGVELMNNIYKEVDSACRKVGIVIVDLNIIVKLVRSINLFLLVMFLSVDRMQRNILMECLSNY